MLGFGFLRDMNDTVKKNRELLKAGKKSFHERDLHYPLRKGEIVFRDKKYPAEAIKIARASAMMNNRIEQLKSLIILVLVIGIVIIIAVFFLERKW